MFGKSASRWSTGIPLLAIGLAFSLTSGCASSERKRLTAEERAALYVDAANAALADQDTAVALQHLSKAEEESPKLPELHHMRALVFATRQEYAPAIAAARKALELNPKYPAASNTLGKLLMDSGKPDEAIGPLLAAATEPTYRETYKPYTNLGILHYRKMEYAKSAEYLDKAIIADPKGACIAYYYRGHILLQKGKFQSAIRDYDQATRRFCAGFGEAHLALGIAYERSKQYDAARKKYLEIQERFSATAVADQAMEHLRYLP